MCRSMPWNAFILKVLIMAVWRGLTADLKRLNYADTVLYGLATSARKSNPNK